MCVCIRVCACTFHRKNSVNCAHVREMMMMCWFSTASASNMFTSCLKIITSGNHKKNLKKRYEK